jgi:antitoxin component of MazEF toxin-antitoxin module
MRMEIGKWGNSAATRIPAELMRELGLTIGSDIEMVIEADGLKISPVKKKMSRAERLEWLLADLDKYGPDEEINWGPDVGNEIVEW